MKDKKKKKLSSDGMSAREKMEARKKKLKEKSGGGSIIFPKEGTIRMRIKSPGEDLELGMEIIYFYDPKTKRSINSPATFNEPCPFMQKFEELKNSRDDDDKELAKLLIPKRKYVIGGYLYSDTKGKQIDREKIDKAVLIPNGVYQDIIDLYLDEDDYGDMSDPKEGYDIKISREGSGKNDTKYSVIPCPKSKVPKELQGEIDLEKIVRGSIDSYEDLEDKLDEFLNGAGNDDDDDEDDRPRKKKSSKSKDKSKSKKDKKKRSRDDDDLPF